MKTKKTIAFAMALALTASMTSVLSAGAADNVEISAEKKEAAAGAEFTLNVSLSNVPSTGINASEFAVTYDSSIIEVTSVTAGSIAQTGADEKEPDVSSAVPSFGVNYATAGEINVDWSTGLTDSSYFIKKDGVFMTIKGTVKDTAKAGDYSDFAIGAISRAEYEGSSSLNSDIILADVSADGTATEYGSSSTAGRITVVDEGASESTNPTTSTSASTSKSTTSTTTTKITPSETSPTSSAEATKYGDVNCDTSVNVSDVILLNKVIVGAGTATDEGLANAECYADGHIDINDSAQIMNVVVMTTNQEDLPIKP